MLHLWPSKCCLVTLTMTFVIMMPQMSRFLRENTNLGLDYTDASCHWQFCRVWHYSVLPSINHSCCSTLTCPQEDEPHIMNVPRVFLACSKCVLLFPYTNEENCDVPEKSHLIRFHPYNLLDFGTDNTVSPAQDVFCFKRDTCLEAHSRGWAKAYFLNAENTLCCCGVSGRAAFICQCVGHKE